jgi:antibiotic biosynthesis monooxygenase (ABM) superfamily enzyme
VIVSCARAHYRTRCEAIRSRARGEYAHRRSTLAVRVTRRVKPERVEDFEEWVSGITAATARFPGYLGAEVLKPGDPSDTDFHIIFKFDQMSDLKRWEDSGERRDWCLRVEPLQEGPACYRG